MEDDQYIIVCGDPIAGLIFTGPFKSHSEALAYAEEGIDSPWWIADIATPTTTIWRAAP